jgi:predicted transcriptional regulator
MEKKRATSIRLSPEAKRLLTQMAQQLGITEAAVIEIAIRRFAEEEAKRRG